MLTPLDDTLWHQLPTTFDHVGTSDPRFFDRYWFATYAPDGSAAFQMTMGAYRNMNVLDGGATVVIGGRQHNVRVSRSLDRQAEPHCAPLSITPVVPLHELILRIEEGDHGVSGEITWTGIAPPYEEHPHFERLRGRVVQEYTRFCQIGTARGWLSVGDQRSEVDQWWACRDHSWGIRRGMAIREPITGPRAQLSEKGHVQAFLYFSTNTHSGTVHLLRRGDDAPYTSGHVIDLVTGEGHEVVDVELGIDFHPSTRRSRVATVGVSLGDGQLLQLRAEALGASVSMRGIGYSGGYDDRAGPGAWRGDHHVESDVWDVSDPTQVVLADGSTEEPWHRVQPVTVSGQVGDRPSSGHGSLTLTVTGKLPAYLGG